jgi:hypothetical protein
MPTYTITAPDGNSYSIEGPEGATKAEVAQAVLAKNPASGRPPSKERTFGEAAKDVGAGLVSGVGSIVQIPGQLYGLATGNFEKTGSLGLGEEISKYGEEMKSAGLKAREAERAAKVQEAEKTGQFEAFKQGLSETITDPALLTSFLAEQAPQILPMLLTGGATAALTAGRVTASALAKGATKEAAAAAGKSAATKAGTTAAIQTGAVMQGADVGSGAYDEIYAELSKTMPAEQAAAETINKARAAGLTGYGLSVVANRFLPGSSAFEQILAGKAIKGSRIKSGALTALKEIPGENIEEVGGKIAQNVAARSAGIDKDIFAGTGETAALATIGGGALGGAAGAAAARSTEPEQPVTPEAVDRFKQEEAEFRKQFGAAEPVAAPEEPVTSRELSTDVNVPEQEAPTELPGGYTLQRREERKQVPETFNIFAEGSETPLTTVTSQEEADQKLQTLTQIRAEEQAKLLSESEKISSEVRAQQRQLDVMEATGQAGTDEYIQAKAAFEQSSLDAAQRIAAINDKITDFSKPLTATPSGSRVDVQNKFDMKLGEEASGTFNSEEEAVEYIRARQPELNDLFKQADDAKLAAAAAQEEKARVQTDERIQQLEKTLTPLLAKFNLQDVGLKVVEKIKNNAGGSYLDRLIQVAIDEQNPIQTMRHESMHALKDLDFFTPQQWNVLKERANKEWIKTYLADVPTEFNGVQMSRLDAYKQMGLTQEELIEEAISDAFGAYDKGATPPPGMIAALYKKLKNFFMNFGQALRGAGFESADDVFQRVERGELKSRKPKAPSAERLSLPIMRGEEVAKFEGPPKEGETEPTKLKPSVDLIGKYFDDQTKKRSGARLNYADKQSFDNAVKTATDEVKYQMAREKSGLDWYEEDVKEAFKQTKKFIPELGKADNRLLFSVMAGIMSPQTTARDNWFIAAKAFEHYLATKDIPGNNPETGGLWQGGTQSPNKKIQLEFLDRMVKDMGQKKALEWLFGDHTVKEINQFRQSYGNIKSGIDGKITDVKPGLYAFGPKVGPFVNNLNGIHDVTVDKWMTRTFNRYFGAMLGPDQKIVDVPTEPQRRAVKALVNEVAKNAGIKPYQVQSLLWFYEQQLFTKMGVLSPSYGFSDGGRKFAEARGRGGAPSVSTPAQATEGGLKDKKTGEANESIKPKQPKLSIQRGGGRESREITPLEGAPSVKGFSGPIAGIVETAERYAKENGIPYKRQAEYVKVDPDRAKRIAQAYEDMAHAPQDPKVRKAYKDLIRQTTAQYEALLESGYKFWFLDMSKPDNQKYASSPFNALRDLKDNKEMGVFPTNDGFGSGADFDPKANPLLATTEFEWPTGGPDGPMQPVLANDLFRAVHDAFGHGIEGAGFRAEGEENAWQAHARLFTGPALGAITSETRGQNSWLNYGPSGETNRTAKVEDTVFADQKTGLMPEWTWQEGLSDDETKFSLRTSFPTAREAEDAAYDKAPPSTKEFKQFFGASTIMDEGRPQPMYHGSASGFDTFSEAKPIFISPDPDFAEQFAEDRAKDEGKSSDEMRIYPLWVRAETPFDYENKDHAAMVAEKIIADQKLETENSAVRLKKSTPKVSTFKKEIAGGLWSTIEDPVVQDALKSMGFDSFYVQEYGNKNLAVFKAEQVKSITGNIGDFSLESKNMRFSLPSIPAQVSTRIGETTFKREEKNWVKNLMEAITPTSAAQFRAQYLNRYNQMSVYDKALTKQMGGVKLLAEQSAEMGALMSDLGSGISASAMGIGDRNGGIPVFRNGITTIDRRTKGLIASLAPLAAYNDPAVYQRYQYWAMVKRGVRLNREGKDTGIDTADVAFAKLLEQKHPEFVSVQKDLIAFNNGLVQYMVDTGVLSKERGYIYTKHADYIPFYRQMDGEKTVGPNLFQSLSGVKPPKALKGKDAAEAPIADFLETMVRNTQSAIQAGVKNAAAQRAIGVATQVQAPGMGATRLNVASTAPNVINILEKGQIVSYETPDPLLINAMMSLNQSELPFMGIISAPANLLRTLVTKEPGFMMANLVRDSLSAWVTSGVSMTPIAGTVINFGKALVSMTPIAGTVKSPGFEALMDAGILGGYEFSANVEQSGLKLQKDLEVKAGKKAPLALRPFKSVWDALEKGTTASDAATRVLVYERVLAETGSEAEALGRALEVMNFHRKGSSPLIRVLTAAVPFFNARLQGLDLFYRASTGNMNNKDSAAIQRQFFVRGMTMMALSVAYWFAVSDDEEYQKQEQETKDNNWIIPAIGAKIPIPFEVGVLFKLIPERIAAYIFGNDTGQDLKDAMFRSAMSTFAFNPVPQAVKPVFEAAYNFNTFTWRPIVGQGMEEVAPQFQTGPGTSNVSNAIGKALGLSPMKVDHVLKGYTGTLGMYGIDVLDAVMDQFGDSPKPSKRFEQMPVLKRFLVDPEARGNVTQYYQLKDAVDTVVRTMNLLEKTSESDEYLEYLQDNIGTLAVKDYVSDTERVMKTLREAKVAIRSSGMTADEKRDALTEIGQAENAVTSQIQEIKKLISDQ